MQATGWTPPKAPFRALTVRLEAARVAMAALETARHRVAPRPTTWKAPGDLRATRSRP